MTQREVTKVRILLAQAHAYLAVEDAAGAGRVLRELSRKVGEMAGESG